ncbi:Uncharacterised protein [Chromobacterium violaceum]|uniref:Uncharacterized protein n=1 Tax=Chromobacterium violaceum TaxID=536 RepID=A0A3S4HQW8_CHRVL|nr:Uncharacterised protein [Chromobacterium violaceum]
MARPPAASWPTPWKPGRRNRPDNAKAGKKTDGHLQHHADALKAWEAGSNTDKDGKTAKDQAGQQPLLVLSAPAGIAA